MHEPGIKTNKQTKKTKQPKEPVNQSIVGIELTAYSMHAAKIEEHTVTHSAICDVHRRINVI